MATYSYLYPLLNNPQWLREQYIDNGLSTIEVAKLAGAKTPNSARQALLRHGIPVRDYREGQVHNREHDFIFNESVIAGCLLGDGYLIKSNKTSKNSVPYFAKTNKYLEHVQYVAGFLFNEPDKFITPEIAMCRGKECPIFTLRGHTDDCLTPLYDKWYPASNGFKKVVPTDLELDSTMLLHWFLDDGSSYHRRKESPVKQITVTFACESFTKTEQDFLARQMFDKWGLMVNIRSYADGTGWRMHLRQSQTDLFFSIIGPPPVASMAYKWK